MNRITQFAVSRRSVTLLIAAAVFISGAYAWTNLQQELLPDIEFPIVTVIAPYPGSGAADVTDQVTKPIERAISGVQRLTHLQSTSANSISLVVAQFSYGTDVKETRAAIEQNLATVGLPKASRRRSTRSTSTSSRSSSPRFPAMGKPGSRRLPGSPGPTSCRPSRGSMASEPST